MVTALRALKWLFSAVMAALGGLIGLSLFYSDYAPGETVYSRGLAIIVLFVIFGVSIGFFNPEAWGIAGLVAWGSVILGVSGFLSGQGGRLEDLALLLLPLALALSAGYLGAWLCRKWTQRRGNMGNRPS